MDDVNAFQTMGGWGWAMMAFGFAFWVAVIAMIAWAVTSRTGAPGPGGVSSQSPRQILYRRFAMGELDVEAYLQAVEVLGRPNRLEDQVREP